MSTPEQDVFPWTPGYTGTEAVAPTEAAAAPTAAPAPVAPPVEAAAAPAALNPLSQALETAVLAAAAGAAKSALPDVEQQVLNLVISTVGGKANLVPKPVEPTITSADFTQAAARSRAFRTLITGLGLSAFWGVINALGSLSGVNFFTKTGLVSVVTMLVTSAVGSVVAYVARIRFTPSYVQQLTQK